MKNFLLLICSLIVVSLIGCAGYGTYRTTENSFQSTNSKDIRVYSITQPDAEYIMIGYISVYVTNAQDAGNDLRDKLKARAAELGADAIINFKLNLEPLGGGGAEGVAIKYK